MTSETRYAIYVLISAIVAATSWILTEVAIGFYHVVPLLVIVLGNLVGGGVLLAACGKNVIALQINKQKGEWGALILAALLIYAVAFLLSFNAIRLIGSGKTAIFGLLQTPFIMILALIFLGEPSSGRRWLAALLAVGGALTINFNPAAFTFSLGRGEIMAIFAPLCLAMGVIILKPLLDKLDARWVTGAALLLGALFMLPLLPFYGSLMGLGGAALLLIVIMGIFRGSSWLVYNLALRQIGAAKSAIIFISFAFFTVMFQFMVTTWLPTLGLRLPENLWTALLGGLLIASGVVLLQTGPK